MKKEGFFQIVIICMFLIPSAVLAQMNKKVLLSIGPGEHIIESESCVGIGYSTSELYLVTKKDNDYFVCENGKRTGPFDWKKFTPKACEETNVMNFNPVSHDDLRYLAEFIRIMDKKFSDKKWNSGEEKLRFYATEYNTGYHATREKIDSLIPLKNFYTTLVPGDTRFCYADISEESYLILKP